MTKVCPLCRMFHLRKNGKDRGVQKYRCMECGYMFRGKNRISGSSKYNEDLFYKYSIRKQTLKELAGDTHVSIRTIQRRLDSRFLSSENTGIHLRLNSNLSEYNSSVLILDATFFGKKGSDTQWGILVAQDGITGDILATKHIFQETLEDYRALLFEMKQAQYPPPHFIVIDGRNGVEGIIRCFYAVPIQMCQSHKIATIDRYLLKHPRRESYQRLKEISHDMVHTDLDTFMWWIEEFRNQYTKDFEARELNPKTLQYHSIHKRLHRALKSILRDIDRIFTSLNYIPVIHKNINTSNRLEGVFSHVKPKVKLHRGLSKERRLRLALSLLWKDYE